MEWDHFDACVWEFSGQLFSMENIGQLGLAVGTEVTKWVGGLEVQVSPIKRTLIVIQDKYSALTQNGAKMWARLKRHNYDNSERRVP